MLFGIGSKTREVKPWSRILFVRDDFLRNVEIHAEQNNKSEIFSMGVNIFTLTGCPIVACKEVMETIPISFVKEALLEDEAMLRLQQTTAWSEVPKGARVEAV